MSTKRRRLSHKGPDPFVQEPLEALGLILQEEARLSGTLLLRAASLERFLRACACCEKSDTPSGVEVTFHGTKRANLSGIAAEGLLPADGKRIQISHDQKFGRAIYTSPDFKKCMQYGDAVVVCLALPGLCLNYDTEGWGIWLQDQRRFAKMNWKGLVLGYRDPSQLLPLAVVTQAELKWGFAAAKSALQFVERRFPNLQTGWTAVWSKTHARPYYYHPFEGRSCWTPPQKSPPVPLVLEARNTTPKKVEGANFDKVAIPEAFLEIQQVLVTFAGEFGGSPSFPGGDVKLQRKLRLYELQALTEFEYAMLTVEGFGRLQQCRPVVLMLNNGRHFLENPGTQTLESCCGFTMHADRPGAELAVQEGPELLLAAFEAAQHSGKLWSFFSQAFDRHSNPCLEGRVSDIVDFLETMHAESLH